MSAAPNDKPYLFTPILAESIAEQVTVAMEMRGITTAGDMAEIAGMSAGSVGNLLKGQRITTTTLQKIAGGLGCEWELTLRVAPRARWTDRFRFFMSRFDGLGGMHS